MGSSPTQVIFLTFLYKVLFPIIWTPAHGIFYHHACHRLHNIQAGWPSGLRRWFKALVTRVALVGVPLLSFSWHSYTKSYFLYFEPLHMVSSNIIHAIDLKTYRQDGQVVWGASLRHHSLRCRGVESYSCHFVDIPIQSIISCILNIWRLYLIPSWILLYRQDGRVV